MARHSRFPRMRRMNRSHLHKDRFSSPQTAGLNGLQSMIVSLDYLGDGVLMTDEEGRIIAWNHALEELSGCDASQVIGQYIWEVQGRFAADPARSEEAVEQALRSLQPFFQHGGGE